MALEDEKYVSVTTFRRTGVGVSSPTWIVPLGDGRVGFWTSSSSGKAKRLRNDSRITLQPSDSRGRLRDGTTATSGAATLVTSGADFDAIQAKVKAKYGVMVRISRFFNILGHLGKDHPYGDLGVIVTLKS
jgi:uncharacterized protein